MFGYKYPTIESELKDQLSRKLDVRKVFTLWHKENKSTVEDLERLIIEKKEEDTFLKSRIIKAVEEVLLSK